MGYRLNRFVLPAKEFFDSLTNFKCLFGAFRHLSKIKLARYVLTISSLNDAIEYGKSFCFIITFATFCEAKDAL